MTSALTQAPRTATRYSDLPFARGYIEKTVPVAHTVNLGPLSFRWPADRFLIPARALRVSGWMLMPDGPFDRIVASVNGTEVFSGEPYERPDLTTAFPHIPEARQAGFTFEIPRRVARQGALEVIGCRSGEPVGRMATPFRSDLRRTVPLPPAALIGRVVSNTGTEFFLSQGYKSYAEMRDAIERHRPARSIRRLLDWGCGCGRLAAYWLHENQVVEVHGCDIDAEAIAWCKSNLPRGTFAQVPFDPPTGYPDSYFDAIASFSVFTHLTADAQVRWLREMSRILAPGGVFAASVHGTSAAWFEFGTQADGMLRSGIHDATPDPGLDESLGAGVYRYTYQTPDYTRRLFGEYFEVIEYVERAVGNNQDLVVMRKSR